MEHGSSSKRDFHFRYYVVRGPESTPYEGGFYLGRLVFPREFPFKPPSIYMLTPNGRLVITCFDECFYV